MLLKKCPHCNTSHVQTNERFVEKAEIGKDLNLWYVVRCQNPHCRRLVLMVTSQGKLLDVYPVGTFELDSLVPIADEIRADFREAGLCLGAGCPKASMIMSRRVLQRCLKEQGCAQRELLSAIDHAIQQDILRKPFHPIATEIKEYGNLGAHPDDDQLTNVTRENAQQILDFARLLIHDLYEVPAAASKLKQSR